MILVWFVVSIILMCVGAIVSMVWAVEDEMWSSKEEFGIWSFFTSVGIIAALIWPIILILAVPALMIYGLTIGAKYAKEEFFG